MEYLLVREQLKLLGSIFSTIALLLLAVRKFAISSSVKIYVPINPAPFSVFQYIGSNLAQILCLLFAN